MTNETEKKFFRERRIADPIDSDFEIRLCHSGRFYKRLKSGGSNFHSESLRFLPGEINVRTTIGTKILFGIFFVAGLGMIAGSVITSAFPLVIFGLFFCGISGLLLWISQRNYIKIDLNAKRFYPNRSKPDFLPLENAAYLYILEKTCRGSKGSRFTCYELNLAMNDGKHYNLLNHGGKKAMSQDAKKLADLLQLPLDDCDESEINAKSMTKRSADSTGLIIVGSIFLLIGSIASYSLCIQPLFEYFLSKDWKETPAMIQQSYVHSYRGSKGKRHYQLKLSYQYRYNNKVYKSERYDFFENSTTSGGYLRRIVRKYPAGKRTVCYVNPKSPKKAILNKNFPLAALFPLFFVNIFPAVGIALLAVGIRKRKNLKEQEWTQ